MPWMTSTYRMPHWCSIHSQSSYCTTPVTLMVLYRSYCSWSWSCSTCPCLVPVPVPLLPCYWSLRSCDITIIVHACNVMDTGSPPIPVHGIQANEVLLCVARHLSWGPGYYKVPGDASPVPFSELVQPQQKQPAKSQPILHVINSLVTVYLNLFSFLFPGKKRMNFFFFFRHTYALLLSRECLSAAPAPT